MLDSVWVIQRGAEGAREFVRIVDESVTWVIDRDAAEPFDTKADALAVAEVIHAETGAEIAVYPLDVERVGPGPDRPAVHSYAEVQQAHRRAVADLAVLRASVA